MKIAVTSAQSSGDLSYGMGTYVIPGADGAHMDHGKWMLVSKKMNGSWKTQCDIFNSDMDAGHEIALSQTNSGKLRSPKQARTSAPALSDGRLAYG